MSGLGQFPPTVSGVFVVSGSNNFLPGSSDFGIVIGASITETILTIFDPPIVMNVAPAPEEVDSLIIVDFFAGQDLLTSAMNEPVVGNVDNSAFGLFFTEMLVTNITDLGESVGFIPNPDQDIKITSTSVTTSGVVIVDIFPGVNDAFVPYVPPIFLNKRVFPVTFSGLGERLFPEENRRIYPVLPQFSIITPGD